MKIDKGKVSFNTINDAIEVMGTGITIIILPDGKILDFPIRQDKCLCEMNSCN